MGGNNMGEGDIKCVFFDRDGIVNKSPGAGYVERLEDFELLTGFVKTLRLVRGAGYEAVVVSNQRGIALGRMTTEVVDKMHEWLRRTLRVDHELDLLDILYCPHDDSDRCACRKPLPGMLMEAARRHGIDLENSWMIGDQERDIEAGRNAGCKTILVSAAATNSTADFRVHDLDSLTRLLPDVLCAR